MNKKHKIGYIAAIFITARLILFISSPVEIIPGYGDFWNFYQQAEMGWPYIDYWTEFPPIFPIISRLLYLLVAGRENAYFYAAALTISMFQAGCVIMIGELEVRLFKDSNTLMRTITYALLTIGVFYSWSYFDPLAVFFLLLSLVWILDKKDTLASSALSLGVLVKWFPFLIIPAMWKTRSRKLGARNTILVLVSVAVVWGGLFTLNNTMAKASLISQANKGSWETPWALLDGNLQTGNFSVDVDRNDPSTAVIRTGNNPVISPWLSLAIFGGFGVFLFHRAELDEDYKFIAFVGVTMVIFFLWSPGYSPQWVLYLLPFAFLVLPENEGYLFAVIFLLLNLLEWPLLLSRGYFSSLLYLIPVRTLLMVLLGVRFYQSSTGSLARIKDN